MKNFSWTSFFFWALAPMMACLFGCLRRADLVLAGVTFCALWLFRQGVRNIVRLNSDISRTAPGREALKIAFGFSVVISIVIQLNYFTHWITLGNV